jgi:antitoxin (DNA-binding transcriptional repressor) of toxin-antitoxin stability system
MSTIAIDISDLDIKVADLIARLKGEQEIILTASNLPVAKLSAIPASISGEPAAAPQRRRGGQSESILWISPDFDEPLEDFKEYMP